MSQEIHVKIRKPCETCDQDGYLYSLEWKEFNKKWNDKFQELQDVIKTNQALKDEGISPPEESEEYACPDCNGEKWIEEWILLLEFKKLIE